MEGIEMKSLEQQHAEARDRMYALADIAARAGNGVKCDEYIKIGRMEDEELTYLLNQR